MKTVDCTLKILETNYRKSSLDALAYADHLEELGRLEEAEMVRVTLDFTQKVQGISQQYFEWSRNLTEAESGSFLQRTEHHRAFDLTLMNGYSLRFYGQKLMSRPFMPHQCVFACHAHLYQINRRYDYTLALGGMVAPISGEKQFISIFSECERMVIYLEDEIRMLTYPKKNVKRSN